MILPKWLCRRWHTKYRGRYVYDTVSDSPGSSNPYEPFQVLDKVKQELAGEAGKGNYYTVGILADFEVCDICGIRYNHP